MAKNVDPTLKSVQAILNLIYDDSAKTIATSGAAAADESTHTPGSTSGTPMQGVYESTPTTLTNNQLGTFGIDANRNVKVTLASLLAGEDLTNNVLGVLSKPVASASYSPSLYAPLTQVTKANIKASTGNVLSAYISNDNAAVRYFQLHNKATAPVATDVPIYSIKVPAGTANNPGTLILDDSFFTKAGKNFATGIGWAISTTLATFTDSATNTEHIVVVHYV